MATTKLEQVVGISSLIDEIVAQGKALTQDEAGARERLIVKARELISGLETPVEMVTWIAWAEVRTLPTSSLENDACHTES